MDEVSRQAAEPLEPVPASASYPVQAYTAGALRSPFQPPHGALASRQGSRGIRPDPQRPRQLLEGFPLDQLQLVGSLSSTTRRYALLRAADVVYRVQVGDYLGHDEGRVVALGESRVELLETLADGVGRWQQRPRVLSLKETR
ncbi:pilus assembly protein PilP [Pseudomonas sp. NFXW11]